MVDADGFETGSPPPGARAPCEPTCLSSGGNERADVEMKPAEDALMIDADTFVGPYSGHSRIRRLMFLAKHAPRSVAIDALRLACASLKQTTNTQLYTEAATSLRRLLCVWPAVVRVSACPGTEFVRPPCCRIEQGVAVEAADAIDSEWINAIDARASASLEQLEADLKKCAA